MTVLHTAYLFDYARFRNSAGPLVEAASMGDSEPVRREAAAFMRTLKAQGEEWILEDKWSNPLPDIDKWVMPLTPEQVGKCFLILLSSFLQHAPAGSVART